MSASESQGRQPHSIIQLTDRRTVLGMIHLQGYPQDDYCSLPPASALSLSSSAISLPPLRSVKSGMAEWQRSTAVAANSGGNAVYAVTRQDGASANGGWSGTANYAVVAPHRAVTRYASCKQVPRNEYEDVWKDTVAAYKRSPSRLMTSGHVALSRSKTWSPSSMASVTSVDVRMAPPTSAESQAAVTESEAVESSCDGHFGSSNFGSSNRTNDEDESYDISPPPPPAGPPRLAPLSGYLSQTTEKGVLRPIAFRPTPAARPNDYVSSPKQPHHHSQTTLTDAKTSADEGYWSRETSRCSAAPTLPISHAAPRVPSQAERCVDGDDASVSAPPSPAPRSFCVAATAEGRNSTSSSSDDGVGELGRMLRDREVEIESLRETLEKNERAIFAACDDRQAAWQKQVRELSTEYQRRLRLQQERASKVETSLNLQLQRAQLDAEKSREESRTSKSRTDECERCLTQKATELEAVKQELHDSVALCRSKNDENAALKIEKGNLVNELEERNRSLRRLKDDLSKATSESYRAHRDVGRTDGESAAIRKSQSEREFAREDEHLLRVEVERLRSEMERRNYELKSQRESIDNERMLWQQEKEKVIQYQKQLQVNYVQMYRKNAQLESELSRLLNATGSVSLHRDCASHNDASSITLSLSENPESLC